MGCVLIRPIVILRSLAKDVKPGKYTVPTGNQTPGFRVAVHYTTTAIYESNNHIKFYLQCPSF